MKRSARYLSSPLLSLLLLVSVSVAESADPTSDTRAFSQAELDQMLAPIALYPDALLSQILMAATYPLEVVQAARWSKANPDLQGDAAVKTAENQEWDPSVKSLAAFPHILSMMDEKLNWTERLGDAFLAQPEQVMDTVQGLRRKADAAGNLKTTEHVRVEHRAQTIVVTSAYPDVIYVPYYDPFVVYGTWWWPTYRPVYWAPWPGYYARPGLVFFWSIGIHIGHGFFFGYCDWPAHRIRVVDVHPFYNKRAAPPHDVWVHEYEHRRGVPYRHVSVHNQYVKTVNTPARRYDDGRHAGPDRDGGKKVDERTDRRERAKRTIEAPRESPRREVDRSTSNPAERGQRDRGGSGGGVADAPGRVRAPVERIDIKRPQTPDPVARLDPPARDAREPARERNGGDRRDAARRDAGDRADFVAAQRNEGGQASTPWSGTYERESRRSRTGGEFRRN